MIRSPDPQVVARMNSCTHTRQREVPFFCSMYYSSFFFSVPFRCAVATSTRCIYTCTYVCMSESLRVLTWLTPGRSQRSATVYKTFSYIVDVRHIGLIGKSHFHFFFGSAGEIGFEGSVSTGCSGYLDPRFLILSLSQVTYLRHQYKSVCACLLYLCGCGSCRSVQYVTAGSWEKPLARGLNSWRKNHMKVQIWIQIY